MRDPSLLVYFRPESGGLIMGGYERNPAPWSLDGIPADFNGKLLAEDWPRFEELMENAHRPRARRSSEPEVMKLINGPEAFTPTASSSSGRPRCAASGRPPASARTASPAPAASGSSSPSGSSRARRRSTPGTWTRAASAAQYRSPRLHARPHARGLRDLLRRQVPGPRAAGRRPLRLSPAYPRLAELGAAFGEKSGWERANWFEPNAARGRRVAAAARLGRAALVAGDRRRAPRLPRDAPRSSTRPPSRRSRSPAPAPPASSSACARTASPATSARSPTPRC